MTKATHGGWLLETSNGGPWPLEHSAWVSSPDRLVAGFGRGSTEAIAVRVAMLSAWHHWRHERETLTGLELAYFGPAGMPGGLLLRTAAPA